MGRKTLVVLAIIVGFMATLAAPASAQEQRELTIEPSNVEAAGEVDFVITGGGFESLPIFILPCYGIANEEEAIAAEADDSNDGGCDIAGLTSAAPTDGAFTAEATYDVPERGFCILAGDQAETEFGIACVSVGAQDADEGLADTGVESGLLAIVGGAMLAAGMMIVGTTRRSAGTGA